MGGTPARLRNAWHEFLRDHRSLGQQFGGRDDESTLNGSLGCTHELMRLLIFAKTGRLYSHDQLSHMIDYPWPSSNPTRRGMRWNNAEMLKLVDIFDLPYKLWVVDSYVTDSVWSALKRNLRDEGPVLAAVKYSHYPEQKGYVYGGVKADGKPNGLALAHGKTQLTGAENIAHAIALINYWDSAKYDRYVFASKDPNHGSPSRPERPPFDIITPTQTKTMLNSIRILRVKNYETGRLVPRSMTYLVPTKLFVPKGY